MTSPQHLDIEETLKQNTVGLVDLDRFRKVKQTLAEQRDLSLIAGKEPKLFSKKISKKAKKRTILSFDNEPLISKKKLFGKDPAVDTSFLPDEQREEINSLKREQLRKEYLDQIAKAKDEQVDLHYVYFEGTETPHKLTVKKGDTVKKVVEIIKDRLPQLSSTRTDDILFIQGQLIIPHHYDFHWFIMQKKRGLYSQLIFDFDTEEALENKQLQIPKIATKAWYLKNKHIYPASRWVPFDPLKNYTSRPNDDPAMTALFG